MVTSASSGPTYSAAYLSELKASTPSTRPRLQDESVSFDEDVSITADSLAQSSLGQVVDLTGEWTTTAIHSMRAKTNAYL